MRERQFPILRWISRLRQNKEAKDKDTPAPSKEGVPQPGKDEKQITIPGMGDPAPARKVVDFTAAWEGAAKGKPRTRLRLRTRASRRIMRRMRPSFAGTAHPRLTRRPPTRPSRNLGPLWYAPNHADKKTIL